MKAPWWDVASRGLRRVVLRACKIDEAYVRVPWGELPDGVRERIAEATKRVKEMRAAAEGT